MEQETSQPAFNQSRGKRNWENEKFIFIGIISFIVGVSVTGGIAYLVLNNSYLARQEQLNTQISVLQNKVNTLERQNETIQTSSTPASPSANEATINKGWKKFISSGKFVFSTDNWRSYSFENDNDSFSFSIEYPSDWNFDHGVFDDSSGKKIAEFSPGLVVLKPGQKCFDVSDSDRFGRSEPISQTSITIGQLSGTLRIEKVLYDAGGFPKRGGYWYPNSYCLSNGNNAFVMSFYEDQLNSDKRELFRKIISTLKFE
jgi:hypothetical protein